MNPLVSVIIPAYNVKPFIREALDSVISQTYENIEIIIIDDGSTDGTGDICDGYAFDSRVTVIHQENKGLSSARNVGLDIIKGEYLCFLDSDDAYHSTFIEKMLEKALSTKADMVVCKYVVQKTVGKFDLNGRNKESIRPCFVPGIYNREDALRSLVEDELNVSVWNKLYKSNLWSNVRFPIGHNYEDMDAMFRVVDLCQTVTMIDDVLHYYRKRVGSITYNYSVNNIRDWMLSCSQLESFILLQNHKLFDDALIERYKWRNMNAYMGLFADYSGDKVLRNEIREIIVEKGKEIRQWNVRRRLAYLMICFTPSLFGCAYKKYRSIRLVVWKVTGK